MIKVLFTGCTFTEQEVELLRQNNINIIPASTDLDDNEIITQLKDCDAVISNGNEFYSEEILSKLPNLKVIQFYGIGYGKCVDLNIANKFNKIVMNTPKVNSYSVAEYTLGLMLTINQKLIQENEDTRNGIWKERSFFDLKEKTIGIIGMGHIGTHLTEILYNAFNANILYYDIKEKSEVEQKYKAKKVSLEELLKKSDIVSLHLPLTDETRNLIGFKELSQMKKEAYFINTARAEIVDGEALYKVLNENMISGSAFDGFYEEPVDLNSNSAKLLKLPNGKFILTAHTGYNAVEGDQRVRTMIINNLIEYFTTGENASIVNKK